MERLQNIDRRFIYVLFVLVVGIPTLWRMPIPIPRFPDSDKLYQAVEHLPTDKPVILVANWGGSTRAENEPQSEALLHHFFRRGIPVIITGWDPQGPQLVEASAERIAPQYGRVYGRDWVNFGYKVLGGVAIAAMIRDIPSFMKQDYRGTPVARIPLMTGVKTLGDCSMLIDVTALQGTTNTFIGLGQNAYHIQMAAAVTAVGAPESYPFLESGQLSGLLSGMRGAAEYEMLVGRPGGAVRRMPAQSGAHLLIILLIILGNLAYLAARRSQGAR